MRYSVEGLINCTSSSRFGFRAGCACNSKAVSGSYYLSIYFNDVHENVHYVSIEFVYACNDMSYALSDSNYSFHDIGNTLYVINYTISDMNYARSEMNYASLETSHTLSDTNYAFNFTLTAQGSIYLDL